MSEFGRVISKYSTMCAVSEFAPKINKYGTMFAVSEFAPCSSRSNVLVKLFHTSSSPLKDRISQK